MASWFKRKREQKKKTGGGTCITCRDWEGKLGSFCNQNVLSADDTNFGVVEFIFVIVFVIVIN